MSSILLATLSMACGPIREPRRAPDASVPTACKSYCDLVMTNCQDDLAQYGSATECEAYCESYVDFPPGNMEDQSGNSLTCRTYHATVAGTISATVHCPHSGYSGGNVCGSWCENFCYMALRNCDGSFLNQSDCMNQCATLPDDGKQDDMNGNTVQCRMTYAALAGTEPPSSSELFCPSVALLSPECQ